MTPQQYKRMIDEYNRKVKQHNDQVRRDIDQYNRDVKRHNDQVNRNIDQYNREVRRIDDFNKNSIRQYNNQIKRINLEQKAERQKLLNVINKFNQPITTTRTTTVIYRSSVQNLESRYTDLENYNLSNSDHNSPLVVDYPITETANSIQLYNSISGVDQGDFIEPGYLKLTEVEEKLFSISSELGRRWAGAIYSLNPTNPDAARHFCTSVREVFIQLLSIKAPDQEVLHAIPNCTLHDGRPSRRERIRYILTKKSISIQPMIEFVDADINELLVLFKTLNDGTHGKTGTFSVQQLLKLKKRAEDSILFITAMDPQ